MMDIQLIVRDKENHGNGESLLKGLATLEVLSRFGTKGNKVVISPDKGIEYNFSFDDPTTQEFYEKCLSEVVTEIGSGIYEGI